MVVAVDTTHPKTNHAIHFTPPPLVMKFSGERPLCDNLMTVSYWHDLEIQHHHYTALQQSLATCGYTLEGQITYLSNLTKNVTPISLVLSDGDLPTLKCWKPKRTAPLPR